MASEREEPFFEDDEAFSNAEEVSRKETVFQARLYRLLLEKYADLINEREKRTIGEIKALVDADDLTVQSILSDFRGETYSFSRDYLESAERVLGFVQSELNFVEPGINLNYWLSPKEIFSAKVGDDEDLAVFLCSLLLALGDEKASVIIAELDSLKTHAFVATEFQETFFILDPAQKHGFRDFSGKREETIRKYSFRGAKIKRFLYKFNHSTYEQFM